MWRRRSQGEATPERRIEARRFEELIRQVAQWQQANQIRAYVKAVRDGVRAGRHQIDSKRSEYWVAWALAHARRIDPLSSKYFFNQQADKRNGRSLGTDDYRR